MKQQNRIAITIGIFDVLTQCQEYLFDTMLKTSLPEGKPVVFVLDDYSVYKLTGSFPIHKVSDRVDNLKYFGIELSEIITLEQIEKKLIDTITFSKKNDYKAMYVEYDDNKNFIGREVVKELGCPIKFIKHKKLI